MNTDTEKVNSSYHTRLATPDEFSDIYEIAIKEGWNPGLSDVQANCGHYKLYIWLD